MNSDGNMFKESGEVVYNDTLTNLLYILIRDYIPSGKLDLAVDEAVRLKDIKFVNGWLAKYANFLSEKPIDFILLNSLKFLDNPLLLILISLSTISLI